MKIYFTKQHFFKFQKTPKNHYFFLAIYCDLIRFKVKFNLRITSE